MKQIREDACERLARHLYLTANTDSRFAQAHWDHGGDQHVNKNPWRARANEILNLVTKD